MALRHAILAALTNGDASGYDLAKAFDITVANYWSATPQQLYRELDKMLEAGLVVARTVEQEKRPNKRMYSLTEEGTAALHRFTTSDPKPIAIRDELLVQVEAMERGDLDAVRTHIQQKLAASETKLKRYEKTREHLLEGRSEASYLANERSIGSYLTLARGITFETENIRWCEFVLTTLAARESRNAADRTDPGHTLAPRSNVHRGQPRGER
ncbi:MAG: PadR family transcriptional regulator [Rhodococcus sp.]|uniref:PadR family transcriptional regulator n=1 Tax=Rhodococcus TaxID=1827 RepID=UPI0016986DE1|nr:MULTISPECIES: PadR family transcriptional regulator [Rhodococcus]NLV80598.1 PadR family transcriptional regulator [Rhodococcus sp. (in: high G+C Gram-positive bacteria)]